MTLTYAPRDDLADKILNPKHFQLFIKQLRNAGHKIRYLVAGEYGDLKGRAHFHAILFFTHIEPLEFTCPETGQFFTRGGIADFNPDHLMFPNKSAPFSGQIPQKRMVHIREWPHGHIKVDWSSGEQSARYVCKYLLEDDKNRAWFSLSKKPALGAAWFAQKAAKAVELGVLPSSFNYLPPGGNTDKKYMMTGATRRDYLSAITTDPASKATMNEWVIKTFEKHERERARAVFDGFTPDEQFAALLQRFEDQGERTAIRAKLRAFDFQAAVDAAIPLATDSVLRSDQIIALTYQHKVSNDV